MCEKRVAEALGLKAEVKEASDIQAATNQKLTEVQVHIDKIGVLLNNYYSFRCKDTWERCIADYQQERLLKKKKNKK